MKENKVNFIWLKNMNAIWINLMSKKWLVVILFLFSCLSNKTKEEKLVIHGIDLKLAHEQEIDFKLSDLGIIDISALSNNNVIDNLNLKVARSIENTDEMFSIVLLDKNGNGFHNDFDIDLIALAPNNWLELNGERFNRLNFVPLKENQSIYIYNHFETLANIDERIIKTLLSTPTDEFITFPYVIPPLVKTTIDEKKLNFSELKGNNKLILFEFWGTWCKPCLAQIPDLKKLVKDYGDRITIVGISSNDKKEKLIELTSMLSMDWPQIQMDVDISMNFGEPLWFPLGILYDQNGTLIRYGTTPKEIIEVLSEKLY